MFILLMRRAVDGIATRHVSRPAAGRLPLEVAHSRRGDGTTMLYGFESSRRGSATSATGHASSHAGGVPSGIHPERSSSAAFASGYTPVAPPVGNSATLNRPIWYSLIGLSVAFAAGTYVWVWYTEEVVKTERHKSIAKDIAREQWRRRQLGLDDVAAAAPVARPMANKNDGSSSTSSASGTSVATTPARGATREQILHGHSVKQFDDDGFAASYMADEKNQRDVDDANTYIAKKSIRR